MDRQELQKLRDLPIEGVAERLGMQIVRHKALCPFHDDHHASLSFSMRRNTFRCFACGAHGGTIDLVMKRQNLGFKEACRWLTPLQLPRGGEFDGAEQKASPRGGLEGVASRGGREGVSNSWKPCFQWVERLLPKSGKEASDGWKRRLKKGMNKTA